LSQGSQANKSSHVHRGTPHAPCLLTVNGDKGTSSKPPFSHPERCFWRAVKLLPFGRIRPGPRLTADPPLRKKGKVVLPRLTAALCRVDDASSFLFDCMIDLRFFFLTASILSPYKSFFSSRFETTPRVSHPLKGYLHLGICFFFAVAQQPCGLGLFFPFPHIANALSQWLLQIRPN